MAVLFAFEKERSVGEANARQYVCLSFLVSIVDFGPDHFLFSSMHFAPSLVISEEDLKEAVKIIGECIPGDGGSDEKGHTDRLTL